MEARIIHPDQMLNDRGVEAPLQSRATISPLNSLEVSSEFAHPSGQEVYDNLESKNWAPWLQFSAQDFDAQRQTFPEGQMVIRDTGGELVAALSASRVEWDGQAQTAPSWDEVAGEDGSFGEQYVADGNTFVLMSMSANANFKRQGISGKVFENIRDYAQQQSLEHIIGDFRPSGFGAYKRRTGKLNFHEYIAQTREDGLPEDPWLRSVTRQGTEFLRPDDRAMVVTATADEVIEWSQAYNPEKWWQVANQEQKDYLMATHQPLLELEGVDRVLECGETGTWYLDELNNRAVYIESNVLGEVPVEPPVTHEEEQVVYQLPAADHYHLPETQVEQLQAELVGAIKDLHSEPDVYAAWIGPDHRFADAIRTLEARQFPEVPELVNDTIENRSLFMALVDTRDNEDRIVHCTRLSGLSLQNDSNMQSESADTSAGFVVIDEAIRDGQITSEVFESFCEQMGINREHSISVETNFRVGDRVPPREGLRISDIGYVTFFRKILEKGGQVGEAGVFASINAATRKSIGSLGLSVLPLPVEQKPIKNGDSDSYDLVVFPTSPETHRILTEIGQFVTVKQIALDHI